MALLAVLFKQNLKGSLLTGLTMSAPKAAASFVCHPVESILIEPALAFNAGARVVLMPLVGLRGASVPMGAAFVLVIVSVFLVLLV